MRAGPDDQPIVLHVHVHGAAQESPAAGSRPRLTGTLFDWRQHYDPVIRRHLALQAARERRFWMRLAHAPALRAFTLFAAYLLFKVVRGG